MAQHAPVLKESKVMRSTPGGTEVEERTHSVRPTQRPSHCDPCTGVQYQGTEMLSRMAGDGLPLSLVFEHGEKAGKLEEGDPLTIQGLYKEWVPGFTNTRRRLKD